MARRALFALLVFDAIAAALLYRAWSARPDIAPIPADVVADIAAKPGQPPPLPELARFDMAHATSRPLFARDRRAWKPPAPPAAPPPPPAAAAPPPPPVADVPPPAFRLVGLSVNPKGAKALLDQGLGTGPEWVERGTDVGGWIVSAITSDAVTVTRGERSVAVQLYDRGVR